MTRTESNSLIIDAYNANPTSMVAALENFSNVDADFKVALLGDMLELGEESQAEHVAVIRSAASLGFAKVCFVGREFMKASAEADFEDALFFETSDALADWLRSKPLSGATVLIKGSRGTRMEKTVPVL